MKVTPKNPAGPDKIQPDKARKARAEENRTASFQEILKNMSEKTTVPSDPARLAPISPLETLLAVAVMNPVVSPASTGFKPVVEEIETFLELLDTYGKKMEDPSLTLKDVHPLVVRMDSETERLRPVLDSLPDGSPVKEILNRALVASAVEVIKFNRGDYN